MKDIPDKISFQKVLETLQEENSSYQIIDLSRFSDLEEEELALLHEQWLKIHPNRRSRLIKDLREIAEEDTLVCFDPIALLALKDPEASVRGNAIELLWEYEHKSLIPTLIEILQNDPSKEVRAAAATALGKYVYLGELEEIPPASYLEVENALLQVIDSQESDEIRRRALEALSFSCHKVAHEQIRRAFASPDPLWVASALFAMGRSADVRWADMVVESLDHPEMEVQFAAVRAAGELELSEAREPLLLLLDSHSQFDEELYNAIIWSLSQIGGEDVRAALELLLELAEENEEDELLEFLEQALENLDFNEGAQFFEMLDLDLPEDPEKDELEPFDNFPEDEE